MLVLVYIAKVPHCRVPHATAHILSKYQESKGPKSDSIQFFVIRPDLSRCKPCFPMSLGHI